MRSRAWSLSLSVVVVLCAGSPAAAHESAPVAPCAFNAAPASTTSALLTWEDVATNETSYRVEQRMGSGAFQQVLSLPANTTSATVPNLNPGTFYDFRVRAGNNAGFSAYTPTLPVLTDFNVNPGTCNSSSIAPCLNNNRYRVQVEWQTQGGQAGIGIGTKIGDDSASFAFFNADNQELLIKVLNACGVNNRYWVFAAATTNVDVLVTVTDTQNGRIRSYINPLNRPFPPIQDTSAFATCP